MCGKKENRKFSPGRRQEGKYSWATMAACLAVDQKAGCKSHCKFWGFGFFSPLAGRGMVNCKVFSEEKKG